MNFNGMNTMKTHQKLKKSLTIGYDILSIPLAWMLSYWIRFNLQEIPTLWLDNALYLLPILMVTQTCAFYFFGLYRVIWRFVSIPDLIRISKATLTGTIIISAIGFLSLQYVYIPRSVPLLYSILLLFFLCGGRVVVRWIKDYQSVSQVGKRTLIVGAGSAAEQLVRDLLRHTSKDYYPVAFIDDNSLLHGKEIHGIRVVGYCAEIAAIVESLQIEIILIAMPSANSSQMRKIVSYCEITKIPFRTLPSVFDIANGKISINTLREVSLEDLLGRDPIALDWTSINDGIKNMKILVTGGGGSIGSELCHQIARFEPQELVVVEQNEFNLYKLEMDLEEKFPALKFSYYLADASNEESIFRIIAEKKPNIIFHAAAYKHVPLLESQVVASVKNNVFGTKAICEAAIANEVDKFILISTDKAVCPTNIMGATKRIAELLCEEFNKYQKTKFITVRFGNVLGSVGSVIPLFKSQIEKGGPITITHSDITRFFMTIPEAAQLILQAAALGSEGEIFVLDMGEPIKITYLAEQMIRLAGLEPEKDIEIIFTGLRPGEKLYEELFYADELRTKISNKKIFSVKHPKSKLALNYYIDEMSKLCKMNDTQNLNICLQKLIGQFNHDIHEIKPSVQHEDIAYAPA